MAKCPDANTIVSFYFSHTIATATFIALGTMSSQKLFTDTPTNPHLLLLLSSLHIVSLHVVQHLDIILWVAQFLKILRRWKKEEDVESKPLENPPDVSYSCRRRVCNRGLPIFCHVWGLWRAWNLLRRARRAWMECRCFCLDGMNCFWRRQLWSSASIKIFQPFDWLGDNNPSWRLFWKDQSVGQAMTLSRRVLRGGR